MSSIADGSIHIQTSSDVQFATPSWLGEVALVACHLQKQGILTKICERVRFARRRFGRYELIDFLAVLAGLCDQWRANAARLLRDGASVCLHLHGLVRAHKLACSLNAQPLFGSAAR